MLLWCLPRSCGSEKEAVVHNMAFAVFLTLGCGGFLAASVHACITGSCIRCDDVDVKKHGRIDCDSANEN